MYKCMCIDRVLHHPELPVCQGGALCLYIYMHVDSMRAFSDPMQDMSMHSSSSMPCLIAEHQVGQVGDIEIGFILLAVLGTAPDLIYSALYKAVSNTLQHLLCYL